MTIRCLIRTYVSPGGVARWPLLLLFALGGLLPGSATTARSQVPGPVAGVPGGQGLEDLHLAWQLAAHGRRARSPLSLTAAADILVSNPTRPLNRDDAPRTGRAPAFAHITELLDEAQAMARGDRAVLGIIQQVRRRADRLPQGPVRGARGAPRAQRAALAGNQRQNYVVTFMGREPALVRVAGNRQTDLNLYIYDEYDNLVASDTNPSDSGTALWTPPRTAKFRIEVRNVGSETNAYWLVTN